MTDPTSSTEPALPTNRAFVVQLASVPDDVDPFRGRVEHLASGRVAHFESLARLREFVERVLAGVSDDRRER